MPKTTNNSAQSGKEPIFLVKPAMKHGGLDYLHISLIALVIILIVFAFALSTMKQGTATTPPANVVNTTYTSAQALNAGEKLIASYATLNTSLSLIPFYSLVNQSKVSYLPNANQWLVVMPYIDPLVNNQVFNISILLNGTNLKPVQAFISTLKPNAINNNSVASFGAISIANKVACTQTKPIPVYLITDPYSPGALNAMSIALNASNAYKGSINVSYYYIFSNYAVKYYAGFGINQTQNTGRYFSCASKQPEHLKQFISNFSIAATGAPLGNQTLYDVALGSGENATQFQNCLSNSSISLDHQTQLADLYNTGINPQFVVNCNYAAIPQTLGYAINYSLSTLPSK